VPALLLATEKALADTMLTADGLLAPNTLPMLPRAAALAAACWVLLGRDVVALVPPVRLLLVAATLPPART
jgi:hypothetical protein